MNQIVQRKISSSKGVPRFGDEASGSMHVVVSESLDIHADVWPTLAEAHLRNAYAFQCRDLLEVWLATMGKARRTQPLFVRVNDKNGNPLMLLPLGLETVGGIKRIGFLDGGIADYNAPILFPGAAAIDKSTMRNLWRRIVAALPPYDAAVFSKMPAMVGSMANPLVLLESRPDRHFAYAIDFTAEQKAQNKKLARKLRSGRNRLSNLGKITFRMAETTGERERYLAIMKHQKRRRYIETRGVDGFLRPGYTTYFDEMTARLGVSGHVNLCALFVNDVPVATHWGLVTRGHFYYLMPSFEGGDWARFRPGYLLLDEMARWCRDHGFVTFDLGVGDEYYKIEIGAEALRLYRWESAQSLRGWSYLKAQAVRESLSSGRLGDCWRDLKRRWRQGSVANDPTP